jgi:hypothetical protein
MRGIELLALVDEMLDVAHSDQKLVVALTLVAAIT